MKSKGRYINLKTAAQISGYASDHIGYLIRTGKIKGKKIYNNVCWQIPSDEIINYCQEKNFDIHNPALLKKKYLSLKDAAKVLGYAPDYIGYLIRSKKILGKKIYSGISWLTTEKAIKEYQVSRVKTKTKREEILFPTHSTLSKLKVAKIFNVGWRLGVAAFVLFLLVGVNPLEVFQQLIAAIIGEEKITNVYALTCTGDPTGQAYGAGWQNPQNAQGQPEVESMGDINSFSEVNSATYKTGPSELIFQDFSVNDNENENKFFLSAKIKLSFAIGEKTLDILPIEQPKIIEESPSEKVEELPEGEEFPKEQPVDEGGETGEIEETELEQEQESKPELEQEEEIPEPPEEIKNQEMPGAEPIEETSPPTTFWNKVKNFFALQNRAHNPLMCCDLGWFGISIAKAEEDTPIDNSEEEIITPNIPEAEEKISEPETEELESEDEELLPSEEEMPQDVLPDLDTKIIIWYSFDGELWWQLDIISDYPLSNFMNGGYFEYDAPFLKNWEDLKNLKIKFEGVVGGETTINAYLDSAWVEVTYKAQEIEGGEQQPQEEELESKVLLGKFFSIFEWWEKKFSKDNVEKIKILNQEFHYTIPKDGKIVATVTNSNQETDGIFHISFYSNQDLVATLYIASSRFIELGYEVPCPYPQDLPFTILPWSEEKIELEIDAKKEWGEVLGKIEYIPLSGKNKIDFDSLELEFVPLPISLDNSQFLGEISFGPQEKGQREITFENSVEGKIIVDTIQAGVGGGAQFFYLDGKGIGLVESGDVKAKTTLLTVPSGKHILVVKHGDCGWENNEGERIVEVYFRENK